ncbi:094a9726-03d4-4d0d-a82e-18c40e950008 [Thermothielavioides terrestris]|uniref:LYR motif-containing protein 2 n=1 Tax=Thermothielavioides terrestris TaxID=2587410 RepID=A0A446BUX7_9PEZI|nr:094a9726-03d4-4d0d-a82e-18c40e950008 [Thermothielavioides terrestris]
MVRVFIVPFDAFSCGADVADPSRFVQRARALALYRSILRSTRRIADPRTRAETRKFARGEFERNRGVTDIDHIRYLLSTGKTEWESMERYIDGL